MYVCCCNGVTDREIKRSVEMKEIQSLPELNNNFEMGKQCGNAKKKSEIYSMSQLPEKRTPPQG